MADVPLTDGQPITKESLFPEGWEKQYEDDVPTEETSDESADLEEESEVLADGEEDESETEDETPDEASGTMRAVEFAKAAGWKLEEFYQGVTVPINGQDVPLGQALNDAQVTQQSLSAVSRERDELREKLNQQATTPMMGPHDPEALKLQTQADLLRDALQQTDWSQIDRGEAAFQMQQANSRILDLERQAQTKQTEHMAKLQADYTRVQTEADKQIRTLMPEWADGQVQAREWGSVKDMASRYGLKPQEIDGILDPRIKHMLRDASKAMGHVETIRKKAKAVRKVGKTLSPGSRQSQPGRGSLKDTARKIREAGSREEALDLRLSQDLGPLPR